MFSDFVLQDSRRYCCVIMYNFWWSKRSLVPLYRQWHRWSHIAL